MLRAVDNGIGTAPEPEPDARGVRLSVCFVFVSCVCVLCLLCVCVFVFVSVFTTPGPIDCDVGALSLSPAGLTASFRHEGLTRCFAVVCADGWLGSSGYLTAAAQMIERAMSS